MKENISVEATCGTDSLHETLRCITRYYPFSRLSCTPAFGQTALRRPARHGREGFLVRKGRIMVGSLMPRRE